MKLKYAPYSPSRLDTATCGYQFQQSYILKRKEAKEEKLPQARGSAVHEIFEKITAFMIQNPNTPLQNQVLREWTSEAINRHPLAYQEIDAISNMCMNYLRKPPRSLTANSEIELKLAVKIAYNEDGTEQTYEDILFSGEENETKVVRTKFIECDYDDPEALMRGRADILTISDDTTTAFIVDHKTQPNFEEADTFQMGVYAWVISRIYPFLEEVQTTLHLARMGFYSEAHVWTKEDLYMIEEQILNRVSVAESRVDFRATPYKNCQYCPYMLECPALKEFIDVDDHGNYRVKMNNFKILEDTQKAVKSASLLNVLEVTSAEIKKSLKKFVESFGPVAIPGVRYEIGSKEEIHWDAVNAKRLRPIIMDIFRKHGVDPLDFMGFSQTFSKTIWMLDKPELVKELSTILPKKVTSSFRGSKG